MSIEIYNFIEENLHRLTYDLENGLVITPKRTNGTLCSSTGYLRVKVNKKTLQVHQILSVIYFNKDCIGMQINHIDGNKLNNKKDNLEVVTQKENLIHMKDNGLLGEPANKKKVDKLTLNDEYICTYDSISDATKDVGLKCHTTIRDVAVGYNCRGEKKLTAKGFKWRFTPEENLQYHNIPT